MSGVVEMAYLGSAVVATVPCTRFAYSHRLPKCSRDGDRFASICKAYHGKSCWRQEERPPTLLDSLIGLAFAAVWPVILVLAGLAMTANDAGLSFADRKRLRAERRRIALDKAIEDAEREAGLR